MHSSDDRGKSSSLQSKDSLETEIQTSQWPTITMVLGVLYVATIFLAVGS